ncbi:unnamed protein product, partial [marine sediment metagenome]
RPEFALRELRIYIMRDPMLRTRFQEARDISSEYSHDRLIKEAKGGDGEIPDEVQRSALVVKTMMWQIEKMSPERYGPRQQVDVTHTYDISKAMERAQLRLEQSRAEKVINGEFREET